MNKWRLAWFLALALAGCVPQEKEPDADSASDASASQTLDFAGLMKIAAYIQL